MKKIFFLLFISLGLVGKVISPYESLSAQEKLQILTNHFINEEIYAAIPQVPQMGKLENSGPINATKYERYYNYIQRLKRVYEERIEQKKIIDETYVANLLTYNSVVNNLQKFYSKEENLNPIIDLSINKAFKIVYGKPAIKELKINDDNKTIDALWYVENIYGYEKYEPQMVTIEVPSNMIEQFYYEYRASNVQVVFSYDAPFLSFKGIIIDFNNNIFKGKFQKQQTTFEINFQVDQTMFENLELNSSKVDKTLQK
ncbi:MAG: hypothetical protein IE909_11030 [Campylobacterales bacterium]|nr:hypothetical protein [Campylobacterales bacterium]